ncbi:hypothetical protein [Alicyclobacillus vulcanalis]|uniref:Spherulation-specific family 4 n=1 Tax=Alicyclobacillus vulcanalis TaxID=252246 RepID=A0A1N7PH00_9BACL|nr:hypothetical protein [Alicyclobacillus vulcanalis]SIT09816.1 hypothetical protein SAMN05421799_11357 [Alicyclobacillus vulcanalis]
MLRRATLLASLAAMAAASSVLWPPADVSAASPVPVGFYYGWVTPETQAAIQGYAALVLGADSESSGYANQAAVQQLVASNPSTAFYGYVNLSDGSNPVPAAELVQEFQEWKALGVRGIFLDLAGSNYGVSRALRVFAVAQVHLLGMSAALNAWDPSDAVGVGLGPGDAYVAEDWYMPGRTPAVQYPNNVSTRDLGALRLLASQGVAVWAVTQESVATPSITADEVARDIAAMRQVVPVATGFAVGGESYGAESNAMVPAADISSALAASGSNGASGPASVQPGAAQSAAPQPTAAMATSRISLIPRALVPAFHLVGLGRNG